MDRRMEAWNAHKEAWDRINHYSRCIAAWVAADPDESTVPAEWLAGYRAAFEAWNRASAGLQHPTGKEAQ